MKIGTIKSYVDNFRKYAYLLELLVVKDIKKKYKGSFLGVLWSLLNPLLYTVILTVIFSALFSRTIENFPVYLLAGRLIFEFFSQASTQAMKSMITSASLIKKVYFPKYLITLAKVISNFIFFLVSLVVLVGAIVVTGMDITVSIIYAPIYLLLLFLFCCGISLILASVTVFFRDIEHIYGIFITALMYASAIFYPAEIIPNKYQFILDLNPLYYFIEGFRDILYYGYFPTVSNVIACVVLSIVSLIIGMYVFVRKQDKFILHI